MTVAAPPAPPEADQSSDRRVKPRPRPLRTIVVFIVAVSVLVSGSVFAFVAASTTDGASEPAAAVRDLLDATGRNDIIGMIASLPPGEREAMRDGVPAIAEELRRLGVLTPISLTHVPGVNVEFKKVTTHTASLSGEVARVQLTGGELVITTAADGFPLPEPTRQLLEHDFHATLDPTTGTRTIDLSAWQPNLVAIRDGGGWHVSIFYTLAEAIRGSENGPVPRFGELPVAVGAENPTAAVRSLIEAGTNFDPTRAVTLILPTEGRALYDYSSLFLPEARRRAQAIVNDETFSIRVHDLVLEASDHGTTRHVVVKAFDARITDGEERRHLVYKDGCVTDQPIIAGELPSVASTTTCDGTLAPPPGGNLTDASRLDKLTAWQGLGRAFPTFVVLERQGRWYVSPTRTVLTTLEEILHRLRPEDLPAFSARLGHLAQLYNLPAYRG